MDKNSPDYEVCLCQHVTRKEIEKLIKETGSKTLNEFCDKTNIGKKCGGCREDIETILNEING